MALIFSVFTNLIRTMTEIWPKKKKKAVGEPYSEGNRIYQRPKKRKKNVDLDAKDVL